MPSYGDTVKVTLAGDMMTPMRVKKLANEYGRKEEFYYGSFLQSLRPLVQSADLAFANLETPVAPSEPVPPAPFVFNAPKSLLSGLKWIGFDVLSVANNHTMDQTELGVFETLKSVERAGLTSVGAGVDRKSALAGRVFDVRGMKVGFLAFTTFINRGSQKALQAQTVYINLAERKKDWIEAVSKMRPKVDVLFLSIHWGTEYSDRPAPWQEALARELHEKGVDVIVGHHPHVLQPAKWFVDKSGRKKLTLYSIGNLVSNQSFDYVHGQSPFTAGNTRDSVLVQLEIDKTGVKKFSYYPLWIDNWFGPEQGIQTVNIPQEVKRLEQEIKGLRASPKKTFLLTRRQMLMDRWGMIYRSLFPGANLPLASNRAADKPAN
ncbi:MAG: CapA family protein [Bdellovibrionales bacterium]